MKTKMNTPIRITGSIAILLLATAALPAADQMTRLDALSGSKMRIEGSSAIHDWQVESSIIGGFLEVGPNFPTQPGQTVNPGKVEAQGQAFVTVRSLKSVKADGSHYEDKMDDKMYEMFKQVDHPRLVYHLTELTLKEMPKDKTAPYVFDSKGDLAVAGVTNKLSMPVSVFVLGENKVKITGSAPLKMSDFSIPPASIIFVKTSDDVSIKFEWMVGQKKPAAAASK